MCVTNVLLKSSRSVYIEYGIYYLLREEPIEFCRWENVRECSESMEQHSSELYDQNEGEEKHEHQSNRFQLQIFLWDYYLEILLIRFQCVSVIQFELV